MDNRRILYIFLDEGGDLNFSASGTKYFTLTGVTKERPFEAYKHLSTLKYDVIESGTEIEYFHASEDRQQVRNQVFPIIQSLLGKIRIDSLIVEKRKTGPSLRVEERFYPQMLGYLLQYIINGHKLDEFHSIIVFTDDLPIRRKRNAIEKTIKTVLSHILPASIKYSIYHHQSKSNYNLQIVDYCNWAIFRKWERSDTRSYDLIRGSIASEFDIFWSGSTFYY
ncbi:MAG: DUF3800 domain-containing protein [Elusimicrobiota bacterium]